MTWRAVIVAILLLLIGGGCLIWSLNFPVFFHLGWGMGMMHFIPLLFLLLLIIGVVQFIWNGRPYSQTSRQSCNRCGHPLPLEENWIYCPGCGERLK